MPRWSYNDYRKAARQEKRIRQLLKAPAEAASPKAKLLIKKAQSRTDLFDLASESVSFENTSGSLLVRDVLTLLTLARDGIVEEELLSMLAPLRLPCLTHNVWSRCVMRGCVASTAHNQFLRINVLVLWLWPLLLESPDFDERWISLSLDVHHPIPPHLCSPLAMHKCSKQCNAATSRSAMHPR